MRQIASLDVSTVLQESAAFAQAASLDTHKALVHIFFAQRATKKVSSTVPPRP